MKPRGSFPLLAASLLVTSAALGQRASSWRSYKLADGMPESACISVSLAGQGKILVKHLNQTSLTEVDGYNVEVLPAMERTRSRVYASPGGQLWTAIPEGLQEFRESNWVLHPVPEIEAELRTNVTHPLDPVPLCAVKQGQVIFLLPERLMKLNLEDPDRPQTELLRTASGSRLEKFSALTLARDGGLWVGGTRGLAKASGPARNIRADTVWKEYVAPETLDLHQFTQLHEDEEGSVTSLALTKGEQKVIVRFDGRHWETVPLGTEKIRQAWQGPGGSLWAIAIDTLLQWKGGAWGENEEVLARQYFDVAVEPSGTFWLATSDGLFRYAPPLWRSPPLPAPGALNSVVQCLLADGQSRVWLITGNTLHCVQESELHDFPLPPTAAQNPQARALFWLKNNALLVAGGEQYERFDPVTSRFSNVTPTGQFAGSRPLGLLRDGTLCLQLFEAAPSGVYRLGLFDGEGFELFEGPAPERLIGDTLSALYAAQNGDVWLSGERGTAWLHDRKWREFVSVDKSLPGAVVAFAETSDGKIWCATADTVWDFDGKTWSALRGGFDRIGDLLRSRDGSIWVASNGGVHRYYQGAWVENGADEGLPGAGVRKLCEDQRGRVWAGTVRGPSLYHPETDPDPPRTRIQELTAREKNVAQGDNLTISFQGQDKWKYTPRDRLLYSYRLDDQDWSPLQEANYITLTDLAAGKHYFQVRAMDRNCMLDPKPANAEFAVVLPWYKETRLILIAFSGLAAALFFAGLAFNRHRQLLRSYTEVERKVTQRTRELELANRELLHSQKMNALGALAAGIAHDFNNILSIIKGSAQIIEDNVGQPQKILTRTDRIKTVVEQGAGIVKAMLGFSRDSDQVSGVTDINQVVEDTLRLLGDRFLREVEVRFEPGPDLPAVPCAKDFLQQILLNFIFNAAEAMKDNRQIVVTTTQRPDLPADLVLKPAVSARYLFVAVRDFGSGIAAETRPRIFEPFFTTKALSARRGTGLGLSMAYQLATKMEAGLAVESVLERGSMFTVILPVRDAEFKGDRGQTS